MRNQLHARHVGANRLPRQVPVWGPAFRRLAAPCGTGRAVRPITPWRGFTLVEVLLAIAIFSMVLASIYSAWSAIMRGSKIAIDAAAAVQRSRMSVRAIEEALSSAQIYAANAQHYWFIAETKGEFARLDLVACLPENFLGSGLYGEQRRLRHVSFQVEPGEYSRNELVLKQWPMLSPPSLGAGAEPYTIVLGRDVDLFKLDFWDPQRKNWVDEWTATNAFPPLVRVAIGMGNAQNLPLDKREIITRVIAPAAIVVPREYQQPGIVGRPGLGLPTNAPPILPGMDPRLPIQPGQPPGVRF